MARTAASTVVDFYWRCAVHKVLTSARDEGSAAPRSPPVPLKYPMMNRRQWLTGAAAAAMGCALRPRFATGLAAASKAEYLPHFVNVTKDAGLLSKTIVAGHESKDFLLSTTGGGIALFDYDNDGWLDIFVVNGWGLQEFPKGQEPTNHLYKNNRNGAFTDVTEKAGLVRHGWGQAVCVGDYDNDGNLDLFVTYYGKNVLYHNNGNGTFTDVTRESGLLQPEDHWNTGAAFVDYDRDGRLDLFVCNYVAYEHGLTLYESNPALIGQQSPILYGVAGLKGTSNFLYRNNGNGTFTDVSAASGISKAQPTYGFTPCVGDYDDDGLLDLIKTNFSDEIPSLYHNEGKGFFTDVTIPSGLGGVTKSVKWGTAFLDVDDDGRPDILIVGGFIYPPGSGLQHQLPKSENQLILLRNVDGNRFADISEYSGPAFADSRCGRGAACGDIFNSGRVAIAINNLNDFPSLLRNQTPSANSWLLVKLIGTKTNRAAIGSRVVVEADGRRQVQEVRSGGSFCSQNDLRLHFGLGAAKDARVRIRWLGGAEETMEHVPANRMVVIQEGKGIIAQEAF